MVPNVLLPISVTVGHWTDLVAMTGCTVILFDQPTLAAVDVRGGAPATRETDLLAPGRLVQRVDAILLTGGSAFGLAAADGVVEVLAERGRGFPTAAGPVPIVAAAALFDLSIGAPVAPGPAEGRAAALSAVPLEEVQRGGFGVGTGATTGKLGRNDRTRPGGFGMGSIAWDGGSITALVAVNSVGDLRDPGRPSPEANQAQRGDDPRLTVLRGDGGETPTRGTSTTLGLVIVNAPCRHDDLIRCAVSAHDGFARSIIPCHTPFDGDLIFVVTLLEGSVSTGDVLKLCLATELAVERAIVDAVAR